MLDARSRDNAGGGKRRRPAQPCPARHCLLPKPTTPGGSLPASFPTLFPTHRSFFSIGVASQSARARRTSAGRQVLESYTSAAGGQVQTQRKDLLRCRGRHAGRQACRDAGRGGQLPAHTRMQAGSPTLHPPARSGTSSSELSPDSDTASASAHSSAVTVLRCPAAATAGAAGAGAAGWRPAPGGGDGGAATPLLSAACRACSSSSSAGSSSIVTLPLL